MEEITFYEEPEIDSPLQEFITYLEGKYGTLEILNLKEKASRSTIDSTDITENGLFIFGDVKDFKIKFPEDLKTLVICTSSLICNPSMLRVFQNGTKCFKFPKKLKNLIFHKCNLNFLPELPKNLKEISFFDCVFHNKIELLLKNIDKSIEKLVINTCDIKKQNEKLKLSSIPNLTKFKKLQYVDFSNNGLTSLPKLPESVTAIDAVYNKLDSIEITNNLKYVNVSNNEIASLFISTYSIGDANLEMLSLANNDLKDVFILSNDYLNGLNLNISTPFNNFKKFKKLRFIDLSNNTNLSLELRFSIGVKYNINDTKVKIIRPWIDDCENIKYSLTNENIPDDMCSICMDNFEKEQYVVDVHPYTKKGKCIFHVDCLIEMYRESPKKNSCPLCREPMCKTNNGFGKLNTDPIVHVFKWK